LNVYNGFYNKDADSNLLNSGLESKAQIPEPLQKPESVSGSGGGAQTTAASAPSAFNESMTNITQGNVTP